ncbi:hypothetical protein GCM10008941_38010 [Rhizomicrobium palustre]
MRVNDKFWTIRHRGRHKAHTLGNSRVQPRGRGDNPDAFYDHLAFPFGGGHL